MSLAVATRLKSVTIYHFKQFITLPILFICCFCWGFLENRCETYFIYIRSCAIDHIQTLIAVIYNINVRLAVATWLQYIGHLLTVRAIYDTAICWFLNLF